MENEKVLKKEIEVLRKEANQRKKEKTEFKQNLSARRNEILEKVEADNVLHRRLESLLAADLLEESEGLEIYQQIKGKNDKKTKLLFEVFY